MRQTIPHNCPAYSGILETTRGSALPVSCLRWTPLLPRPLRLPHPQLHLVHSYLSLDHTHLAPSYLTFSLPSLRCLVLHHLWDLSQGDTSSRSTVSALHAGLRRDIQVVLFLVCSALWCRLVSLVRNSQVVLCSSLVIVIPHLAFRGVVYWYCRYSSHDPSGHGGTIKRGCAPHVCSLVLLMDSAFTPLCAPDEPGPPVINS